jgi:1-acyl-sn-glycerol-3-phosphate acyltransferase
MLTQLASASIVTLARTLTGVRAIWLVGAPQATPTVYFANHRSHGDFVLLWTSLPPDLRSLTRPVAAADYWLASPTRRFIGCEVFRAVLIDRTGAGDRSDPITQMATALDAGDSLILFPEGTRNESDEALLPFKSGLFHLSRRCPNVRLVPVWINNVHRVLPKGAIVPLPLACSVTFGAALWAPTENDAETKQTFLADAQAALLALRPEYDREA